MGFKASVVLFLTAVSSVGCGDNDSTLYLLVLAPFPNESDGPAPQYDAGPALVPAVRLAVEHINNQSDILCNYSLDYIVDRSGCQLTEQTIISFTRHVIHSEKHFVGIIGPACSESALMVAALAVQNRANIVQIAPTAVSPLLDSMTFGNTFRGLGSAVVYADIARALMKSQNWTRVGAVYETTRKLFSSMFDVFKDKIPKQQLVFEIGLDDEGRDIQQVSEIKDNQTRIIFVFAGRSLSRRILCLAYKMDLVYPTYQWIFHHRELSNFRESTSLMLDNLWWNCSLSDMEQATEGIILNLYSLASRDDNITVANRTYDQYRQQYVKEVGSNISGLEPELEYSNVYYDSVWALALSLNSSVPFLKEGVCDPRVIQQKILEVDFEGMSGTIRFNSTTRASETTRIDAFLVRNDSTSGHPQKNLIGCYDPLRMPSKIEIQNRTGLISDKFDYRPNHVSLGVGIFLLVVTVAVILLVFILHMVNIVFHNEKSLKASSPHLNHLIFSGCYVLSVMIIIIVLAEIFIPSMQGLNRAVIVFYGVNCSIVDWCYSVSYSLIIGAVCAKQWRIYQIFSRFRRDLGRSINDSSMIGLICVVVLVDVIYNVVWNAVDPWMVRIEPSETFPDNVIMVKFTCQTEHLLTRLLILSVLKGLLAIIAITLATLNRHVHLKVYNETKSINILAYAFITISAVGSAVYIFLPRQSSWFFLLPCVVALLDVFLCIFLLFIPPIAPLVKQKFVQR